MTNTKNPDIYTAKDSSGEIALADFQQSMMSGLLYYIQQIFKVEKPDIKEIAKKMNCSEATVFRIRQSSIEDIKNLPQVVQLAKILGVNGKVHFELWR